MICYHTTERRNLKSILTKGLLRRFNEIYFTDTFKSALIWRNILSGEWGTKNWIILAVNLPRRDLIFKKNA